MSDQRRSPGPRIKQPQKRRGTSGPLPRPRVRARKGHIRDRGRSWLTRLGKGGQALLVLLALVAVAGGLYALNSNDGPYRPVAAGPALTPAEEMADSQAEDEVEEAVDEDAAEEKGAGPTKPDRAPTPPPAAQPTAPPAPAPPEPQPPAASTEPARPAPEKAQVAAVPRPPKPLPPVPPPPAGVPAWRHYAVQAPAADGRPRIVIVIDDMGLDRRRSDKVVGLPGPLTLAWLPYARDLGTQTAQAHGGGHELIVHMPMEPSGKENPGPNALFTQLGETELRQRLAHNLSAFSGFVGINNHMGSRFTADSTGMAVVLSELSGRGLLFLDSRTTADSKAASLASHYQVPMQARDVFLDHVQTPEAVAKALAQVESIARRKGSAIAIGHPHDVTIAALTRWLPTLEAKGFQLVPLTAVVNPPAGRMDGL
ncbi:divergent polysaccharide deacetylase family protein [Niveispirillum irakense]|uniref:divergent polysaccharide deacetylase family protein n=1 Tax=Niveispirillum irakense TaxID=34011 RepID=UPI000404609B|nr:divergent polysaccharide deacetylase family protein [Niveispirillum irakense]